MAHLLILSSSSRQELVVGAEFLSKTIEKMVNNKQNNNSGNQDMNGDANDYQKYAHFEILIEYHIRLNMAETITFDLANQLIWVISTWKSLKKTKRLMNKIRHLMGLKH